MSQPRNAAWHEWTRTECAVRAEGAVEPHTGLASQLERGERLTMRPLGFVHGLVARKPDLVEQIGCGRGKRPRQSQAAQDTREVFVGGLEPCRAGCQQLGEQFSELPKLEQRRCGVVGKVTLGQRGQRGKIG